MNPISSMNPRFSGTMANLLKKKAVAGPAMALAMLLLPAATTHAAKPDTDTFVSQKTAEQQQNPAKDPIETLPDGTIIYDSPQDGRIIVTPDGTLTILNKNGSKQVVRPDGAFLFDNGQKQMLIIPPDEFTGKQNDPQQQEQPQLPPGHPGLEENDPHGQQPQLPPGHPPATEEESSPDPNMVPIGKGKFLYKI